MSNNIYEVRIKFLHEFEEYLSIYLGENTALLWRSVLEDNIISYDMDIYKWSSINDKAWQDAVTAFANLTEDIRKAS